MLSVHISTHMDKVEQHLDNVEDILIVIEQSGNKGRMTPMPPLPQKNWGPKLGASWRTTPAPSSKRKQTTRCPQASRKSTRDDKHSIRHNAKDPPNCKGRGIPSNERFICTDLLPRIPTVLPQVSFPTFNGKGPLPWLNRCEQFLKG